MTCLWFQKTEETHGKNRIKIMIQKKIRPSSRRQDCCVIGQYVTLAIGIERRGLSPS